MEVKKVEDKLKQLVLGNGGSNSGPVLRGLLEEAKEGHLGRRQVSFSSHQLISPLLLTCRYDGIVTALCQPNLKFSVPYDISSWGSCLAKCPASKPVPPTPLDKHKQLLLDQDYMTEEKVVCKDFSF